MTLHDNGIGSTDCSCPIGGGCKHVAALLLAWLHEPDDFAKVEETQTALERRTKDELIGLIRLMLARYPDLETLLELPVSQPAGKTKPISPEMIQRQVARAFPEGYDDWEDDVDVASQLAPILDLASQYM